MLQTEYVRSLNCNYERILLDGKPEEHKYQYCMLSRGGIRGLLSCSLRYINGVSYLYYDISSKQSIVQLYDRRPMERQWVKDFFWSFKEIRLELGRFLLDEQNVLWYPQQVFQDLESNIFSFLYVPYYEGDNGFGQLLEYFVEHIDYEDEVLVECIYKMYEQFERAGQVYLQEQIFEDAKMLDGKMSLEPGAIANEKQALDTEDEAVCDVANLDEEKMTTSSYTAEGRKGILSLFGGRKKRDKDIRDNYQQAMQQVMSGYAVAEESAYDEEEWGKTVYVEEISVPKEVIHCLCTPEGKVALRLDKQAITIGKKKGEVDFVLEDMSASRLHARIIKEQEEMYVEDLNSTNGTFKNGLRMQPYEKRKLEEGDEIRFGKKTFVYC